MTHTKSNTHSQISFGKSNGGIVAVDGVLFRPITLIARARVAEALPGSVFPFFEEELARDALSQEYYLNSP